MGSVRNMCGTYIKMWEVYATSVLLISKCGNSTQHVCYLYQNMGTVRNMCVTYIKIWELYATCVLLISKYGNCTQHLLERLINPKCKILKNGQKIEEVLWMR